MIADVVPDTPWLRQSQTQDKYTFAPGGVINANAATFPATVGNGMTSEYTLTSFI